RKSNRQSITGIVINNGELSVSKKWVRNFRAAIFNAKKQKIEGSLSNGLRSEISGMAAWLKSVNEMKYDKMIKDALDVIRNN
ncbi:MAG: RNA-directed DNA polymerase, partial [Bacillota bacterium]|nr:RNA-directed DNA polymerase [Bacillota bacterium]